MLDEEPELLPPHKSAWPQLTPAACFKTFVLSQLLWTGKLEHRCKAAQLCLYDLADWLFDRLRQRSLSPEDAQEVTVLCGVRRVELAGYRELFAH